MTQTSEQQNAAIIRAGFWLVLGRAISEPELRDQLRAMEASDEGVFVLRLLSSPEFRLVRLAWLDGRETVRNPDDHEAGLRSLGSDEWFVDHAYRYFLGREADAVGRASLLAALGEGQPRVVAVRAIALFEEFTSRYRELSPEGGFVPRDVQLCELANPAKWDNPDWIALLRDLKVGGDHKLSMHRKSYEFTQLVFGLRRLGFLDDATRIVSVGAGHEAVLYWLANHVGQVVATDMYEGIWQTVGSLEGDAQVVQQPEEYAPFPYRRDRLTFRKMDGRHLTFADASFDAAYSLSSIEHFGGFDGARDAIDEMGRVVRPGGILAVATEFLLDGPGYHEAFGRDEIHALFDRPGLRLVQPIDDRVWERYEYAEVDLRRNPFQTPHMVVRDRDAVFTTVMVFLEKAKG